MIAADAPAPDTRPAAVVRADAGPTIQAAIEQSFNELADVNAEVRERARADLMAMDRRHLPLLQSLVEHNRPILPAQAAVLRTIVTQVYLAGEPYESGRGFGFLGVRMHPVAVRLPEPRQLNDGNGGVIVEPGGLPGELLEEGGEFFPRPPMGVIVVDRLPGFVGARLLRDGDVILAFADRPEITFGAGAGFTEAVKSTPAGRPIHLLVLRQGRVVKVTIPLDPRPTAAEDMRTDPMNALDRRRREKAEQYWNETFAPLLDEKVG